MDKNARYASQASGGDRARAATQSRITQLEPPGGLDFDSSDLSHTWKRWSEEIQLYTDLALEGRDEKVKLFLYIVGSKSREIYETLPALQARRKAKTTGGRGASKLVKQS